MGVLVGLKVGILVGLKDGTAVGLCVGTWVGVRVGAQVVWGPSNEKMYPSDDPTTIEPSAAIAGEDVWLPVTAVGAAQ